MDFFAIVSEWDERIRKGEGVHVYHALRKLRTSDIPRAHRPAVAAIARRMGLLKQGLTILREDYLQVRESNAAEHERLITEYCALLTEIGATRISAPVLERFQNPQHPSTYLYRALMRIKRWEYEQAAPDLEAFIQASTQPYWQAIGRLNLLATSIFLHRWDAATALAHELEKDRPHLPPLPQGILDELNGQILFFTSSPDRARQHFEKSFEALAKANNPAALFSEKWLVITEFLNDAKPESSERFSAFRSRVESIGQWEILRELDRFRALRLHDENTLNRLYFGSPFNGYRQMIVRDMKWNPPAEAFVRLSTDTNSSSSNILDLATVELLESGNRKFQFNPLEISMLKALTGDLYRPLAVGSLFEQMYPGQYYDPVNAAQRVYQVVRRFRAEARKQGSPLKLRASKFGFSLAAEGPLSLRYTTTASSSAGLEHIRRQFGDKPFSAADLALFQDQSQRNANRWLGAEVLKGTIETLGRGRSRKYKLKAA